MVVDNIADTKAALRQTAKARRAALPPAERAQAADAVVEQFFSGIAIEAEQVIAGYWPIGDELDCRPMLLRLLKEGRTVVLPAVVERNAPLQMRVWDANAPLYPAGFGTLAPSDLAPQADPDLVLVPLLGFDHLGTRLGYGGGYYDRSFAGAERRPRLVGLGFAAQQFESLPRDAHDVILDAVVTEAGVQQFGGKA